jgi:uncharacterized membrane protein YdjX (TVP38/TMEM64 family)
MARKDRGEALLYFQEAAKAHLEALVETGRPIPFALRDRFILAALAGASIPPGTAASLTAGSAFAGSEADPERSKAGFVVAL